MPTTARAIQLALLMAQDDLEAGFLSILEKAKSNLPENENGRVVYEKFVKPALMTREKVAAHYAISSLFESYPEEARIYSFVAKQIDRQVFTAGHSRLVIGTVKITFVITRVCDVFHYVVVHMGDHNLNCGVCPEMAPEAYQKLAAELRAAFERADFPELIRLTDKNFGETHYSIRNLFRDEQRKVLNQILTATREEIHNTYRLLTDRYATLARFLNDLHVPPLNSLTPATEFVLNSELCRQFENGHTDPERVKSLMDEVRVNKVSLDSDALAFAVKKHLDRMSDELVKSPEDLDTLHRLSVSAGLARTLPLQVNLWKIQNTYDQLSGAKLKEMRERTDDKSKAWVDTFMTLGRQLDFQVQAA